MVPTRVLIVWLTLTTAAAAAPAESTFRSGPGRVTLLELYTSEGCSSCPPAEDWFAGLRDDPGLWRTFVPVALHVNYWDRLGWRDELANKTFTDREYAYAAAWHAESVYTPCFVSNGAEWHPRDGLPAPEAAAAGELVVTIEAGGGARVVFTPSPSSRLDGSTAKIDATVALLGAGIVRHIAAGENAGRSLRHEFAALAATTIGLTHQPNGQFAGMLTLPTRPEMSATRHALAAWIAVHGSPSPLQSVGGWLD